VAGSHLHRWSTTDATGMSSEDLETIAGLRKTM
jgi:hypothetical protein